MPSLSLHPSLLSRPSSHPNMLHARSPAGSPSPGSGGMERSSYFMTSASASPSTEMARYSGCTSNPWMNGESLPFPTSTISLLVVGASLPQWRFTALARATRRARWTLDSLCPGGRACACIRWLTSRLRRSRERVYTDFSVTTTATTASTAAVHTASDTDTDRPTHPIPPPQHRHTHAHAAVRARRRRYRVRACLVSRVLSLVINLHLRPPPPRPLSFSIAQIYLAGHPIESHDKR
jgi:hypothetical protein